jgi:hemerythrin
MSHFDFRLQRLGVPEMDADHHDLVTIANRIDDLVSKEPFQISELAELIVEFKTHSAAHFAREEVFMESIGFPDIARHRLQHQRLIAGLDKIFDAVHPGEHVAVTLRVFMATWLFEHINKVDSLYAAFAADCESGLIPKAA